MALLAAHKDSDRTAGALDNLVSYARFLERRAWRERIAADHRRFEREWRDIQRRIVSAVRTDRSGRE